MYTLICKFGDTPKVSAIVIGIYPIDYDNTANNADKMFFRYTPPLSTWFFILMVAI